MKHNRLCPSLDSMLSSYQKCRAHIVEKVPMRLHKAACSHMVHVPCRIECVDSSVGNITDVVLCLSLFAHAEPYNSDVSDVMMS